MIELADVVRRFAGAYLEAHGAAIPASHRRAIADIIACRTQTLGGQLWRCDHCQAEVFAYHSCKNRSCPKCHTGQTRLWLDHRRGEILPAPYFHVIVTLPAELRAAQWLCEYSSRKLSFHPAGFRRRQAGAQARRHIRYVQFSQTRLDR